MNTAERLNELGFSPIDKICVFCSITTDRWNYFCVNCKEYKGLMSLIDAVDYYGEEILGL